MHQTTFRIIKHILSLLFLLCIPAFIYAAPTASWYLDELGSASSAYTVSDSQANYNGTAYSSPSAGSGMGKICSAVDLTASSTSDYVKLDKNSLSGAGDFTISGWIKTNSTSGRSLLSGARAGRDNELIMWFTNATRFNGYIDGASGAAINIPSIADGKWQHLAWRRAGNNSCFFTNGVKRGCVTVSTKTLLIESLIMGQEQDNVGGGFSSAQDWEGLVDEFIVFKNALSDTAITSIYNNQKAFKTWDGNIHVCPTPPADNNYSDWHFDELSWNGTANEIVDSHGGHHGTGHSVSAVPGKVCNAIDLRQNSINDYATLGAAALNGADDFTISVWHKSSSSNGKGLLSGASNDYHNDAMLWFSSSTSFNGHVHIGLGGITTPNIADNNWHHFAWIRQGTQSCFYMDAVSKGCQQKNSSTRLNIVSLILGQDQDNVGGAFDVNQDWEGLIDELIIFRRAFSGSEISSIYNNQNNGKNWDGGNRNCPLPAMFLKKTSQVISDPINSTTNPKRIPGSIIRYTIKATNNNLIAAENIIISDSLATAISAGKLSWQGNITVASPNINSGSTKALTDITGDDEGEFTNNKLTVRCGNITNSAPCTVKYDVKVTN